MGEKMNIEMLKAHKEDIAAKVHDAWWDAKKAQGFHAPLDCTSAEALYSPLLPVDRKYRVFCRQCHVDMYPYDELPKAIQDYDRVTVDAVLDAIEKL